MYDESTLKAIVNATICIIGIAIILIHAINLFIKKYRRKDENRLLLFLLFTAFHFAIYLTFTIIKLKYTSDPFIISFYTIFYIFNNIEVFLFFLYVLTYVKFKDKTRLVLSLINYSFFGVFIILDIVNIFTHIFFKAQGGVYVRNNLMILSQGYQFIMFALTLILALINKNLALKEKAAFISYVLLPIVAIILQNRFAGYAIAYLSIVIAIEILFLFLNVQKNDLLIEQQEKYKEAQVKVMMSQIQPHFVYNSLSSISTLIPLDPAKAQSALDSFTEYLRHNLSSLTETKLIPFEAELKHIETYIELEKIRFNDRINVIYDIKVRDFNVPPLSIQPIVENAIKHGILKKIEGGTLTFKTYKKDNAYIVEVVDDGVGFDLNDVDFSKNVHLGLNNIQYRLNTMCDGSVDIISKVGKGTKVVITFKH